MVVPVFITNCHVSEKPKMGPLTAHTITTLTANKKVVARPAASEVRLASSPKNLEIGDGSLDVSRFNGTVEPRELQETNV